MAADDDPRDFAFVAGQSARTSESERADDPLLSAIAILLDWRTRSSFHCRADVVLGGTILEFDVTARPRGQSYTVVNTETAAVYEADPRTGMLTEGSTERPLTPHDVSSEPLAVRLAFPLSLGIWGRPRDGYRPTGARFEDDTIVMALVHQQDPSLSGSLTIDRRLRLAVRVDTPTLSIGYRDIEPLNDDIDSRDDDRP